MYVSFLICNVLRFVNYIINLYDDDDDDDDDDSRLNILYIRPTNVTFYTSTSH